MAEPHGVIAAVYPRRKANSGLPGNVFGRDLQDLRRLRPGSGCHNWIPGPWRLAAGRGRDSRPRCPIWRKLGIPGSSHDGRSRGRRSSLTYNPCQQQLAGVLAFWSIAFALERAARKGIKTEMLDECDRHSLTGRRILRGSSRGLRVHHPPRTTGFAPKPSFPACYADCSQHRLLVWPGSRRLLRASGRPG